MEVSLHELTRTRDCKVTDCPREALDARGRYAGLCSAHKRDALAVASAAARASAQARRESRPVGAGGSITTAARAVLETSKDLERALVGIRKAEARRVEAAEAWRASVADLLATTRRYLEA